MNLQGRDLKLDLSGDDVRQLHSELAQIGLQIPNTERRSATFGEGTCEVVISFLKGAATRTCSAIDVEAARARRSSSWFQNSSQC